MKQLSVFIILVTLGCSTIKEINVEMVTAQLVRIDTVFRNTSWQKQQLIWRDADNIEYVSSASMGNNYMVGTTMTLLRQR